MGGLLDGPLLGEVGRWVLLTPKAGQQLWHQQDPPPPPTSLALLGHPRLQRGVRQVPAALWCAQRFSRDRPAALSPPRTPTPAPTHRLRGMLGEQDQGERGRWGWVVV